MNERLTKQKIDKFTYAGGWDVRWDSDVTGLGVRLYPTGKKSFVLSYRLKTGSRPKRLTVLGPVGVITVDQARSIARLKLAEVIQGGDPAGDRGTALSTGSFDDFFALRAGPSPLNTTKEMIAKPPARRPKRSQAKTAMVGIYCTPTVPPN